jgi:hypothetical protein
MTEPEQHETPVRPRRTLKRVLAWVGVVLGGLLLVALVLYGLGGPGGVTQDVRDQHAALVVAGKAPAVEDRFVIPIPGCTCHSDDPVLIVEHAERRMRDCFGTCH